MKLETWDDLEEGNPVFCSACGKQVQTIDEISERICHICKNAKKIPSEENAFFCWACGRQLGPMSEIAQGICQSCRASIIRKLKK
jgi:hypothetical protein